MNQEFKGTVDNVAGRDIHVQDKSTSNSNVINLNLNGVNTQSAQPLSGEPITWQQAEEIRELVNHIAERSKLDKIEVYRKFSAHFDGIKYVELPRERYREAAKWLGDWAERLLPPANPQQSNPGPSIAPKEPLKTSTMQQISKPCLHCAETNKTIVTSHRILFVVSIIAVAAMLVVAYLLHKNHALADSLDIAEAHSKQCEFDSKTYSVGSSLVRKDQETIECVIDSNGATPKWIINKPKIEKKYIPKRKHTDSLSEQPDTY